MKSISILWKELNTFLLLLDWRSKDEAEQDITRKCTHRKPRVRFLFYYLAVSISVNIILFVPAVFQNVENNFIFCVFIVACVCVCE
jgi:hypothetical protein